MTARTGRPMTSRLRVRGWLRTESPLHVGGLGMGRTDTLPLAVDGLGRLYVPGTSLAGVLRSWMNGAPPDRCEPSLWGYTEPGSEKGQASRVVVHDGLITRGLGLDSHGQPADPLPHHALELRTSVGIDRVTGTAAPEILYSRSVVPAGYHIRLELDVESDEQEEDRDRAVVGQLLAALMDGEIRLGAATGRGLGRVRLLDSPLALTADRFDTPEGLLAALRDDPARAVRLDTLKGAAADLPLRRELVRVRVAWRPLSPVMSAAREEGRALLTMPLVTRAGGEHVRLVLPGSAIKGVLRARAEFIERTVRGKTAVPASPGSPAHEHSAVFRDHLDQLDVTTSLFGAARKQSAKQRKPAKAGALRAEECLSDVTIPANLWRAAAGLDNRTAPASKDDRPTDLPSEVRDRLAELGLEPADHVAINRWTGGAADGLLFRVLEPHGVTWEPLRLTVDLTRLGDDRNRALALLLLVLRDVAAGRVQLGAYANRGFGDIEVEDVTLEGGPWPHPTSLSDALATPALADAWQHYVSEGARR